MEKKTASSLMMTLLSISMLILAFNTQEIAASSEETVWWFDYETLSVCWLANTTTLGRFWIDFDGDHTTAALSSGWGDDAEYGTWTDLYVVKYEPEISRWSYGHAFRIGTNKIEKTYAHIDETSIGKTTEWFYFWVPKTTPPTDWVVCLQRSDGTNSIPVTDTFWYSEDEGATWEQFTPFLFEEDFESYDVGSFPSDRFYAHWGGWSVAQESEKLLRSVSDPGANWQLRTEQKFPGDTTIEFMSRSDASGVEGSGHPAVFLGTNPIPQVIFPGWWGVSFQVYSGTTWFNWDYSADGVSIEGDWVDMGPPPFSIQPGVWYKTKATLDERYAKFHIDDSLIFEYDVSSLPFVIDDFFVVWNTWGQKDLDSIKVYLPSPTASFAYSPCSPYIGETVTFDASASYDPDGTIVSYLWSFGDGTTGTGVVITHTYAMAGIYSVSLTVTDNDGLSDTLTKSITIGKLSSTISISASPTTITNGEIITISGSITPRVGAPVALWYRLSGDAAWSALTTVTTDENSQYAYVWVPSETGTYELKASWQGDKNTYPAESSIIIVVVLPIMLVHDIAVKNVEASPTSVMSGDPVMITVTVENQGNFTETFDVAARCNGSIIATATMVDLPSGSSRTLTFVWDTSGLAGGTYVISGGASLVSGEVDTADNHFVDGQVTVITDTTPPTAIFTYAPTEPNMNDVVAFDASASTDNIGIVMYEWDFGDEATATGMIVTHAYTESGTYNAKLTVRDAAGNADSTSATITVGKVLSIKLSGEFDYMRAEPVRIRLAALVRDAETVEPVSNALVNVEIYDDAGNLWVSASMQERIFGSGIYEWKSGGTIGQLRLSKGVYLVRASASFRGGPVAYDILLFHIDPPSENSVPPLTPLVYYLTAISILIAGTTIGITLLRRHRRLRVAT